MRKNVALWLRDIFAFSVHLGNGKSDFIPDSERFDRRLSASRSVRCHIALSCSQMCTIDISLLIRNERCSVQSWICVTTERPFGPEPCQSIGGLTVKPRITCITLTVVLLSGALERTVIAGKLPLRFHPLNLTRSLLPLDLVCPIALAPHPPPDLVPQSIWSPAQLCSIFGFSRRLIWSPHTDI
jgi:hypothetical protein